MTISQSNYINIGGYDENAFKDNQAVSIFSGLLLKSGLIMPNIGASNTIPNIDGYIELCEDSGNKKIPFATFHVQIKTLPQDYKNRNQRLNTNYQYKYSCDTKAFNFAYEIVSSNPVLLIMVDLQNDFVFWKHLSVKYCKELESWKQDSVTVYFNDDDRIFDVEKWRIILKEIYEEKSSDIVPSAQPIPEDFLSAFDRLNHTLDNELAFLKRILFPTTWKFGISYFTDANNQLNSLGIYRVIKGENNTFFKEFDTARDVNFSEMQYFGYNAEEIIDSQLKNWIDILFQDENYFFKIMPTTVIQDIIFHTLDSHFSIKAMRSISAEVSVVNLNYTHSSITLDELNSLILNEDFNCEYRKLLRECTDELSSRMNKVDFKRFWEIPFRYKIKKNDNCHTFEPEDKEQVKSLNRKNLKYLLTSFPDFQKDTVKMLGERTAHIFDTSKYLLYINPNLQDCNYIKLSCNQPQIAWFFEKKSIKDITKIASSFNSFKGSGGFTLNPHFYWYDIWQMFCRHALMNFVQSTPDDSLIQILHFPS